MNTVGESFTVYKVLDVDVSLPRRESKIGRGHRAFAVTRRSGDAARGSGAAPGLHGQRDRLGSADRRLARSVRRPERSARAPGAARRRSRGRSATTASACCAGFSSRRASTSRWMPDTKEICRRIPLDDLPAERIWGEIEKLLLLAERPSVGFALALELGSHRSALPRAEGARRLSAGAGVASRGRRLGAHAARHRRGAPPDRRSRPPASSSTVMLGAVCHDLGKPPTTAFVDGRIRSIDHEQAGVAPTTALLTG